MEKVTSLPISVIEENPQALRTSVEKGTLAYEELRDGIKEVGLLNPISVRAYTKEDGSVGYRLVDGLHRKTVFEDLGYAEIPVNVVSIDDSKLLVAQIIGNQHIKTTKTQFAQAIKQLIQHEGLTVKDVSRKVAKSEKWVNEQLGLLDLPDAVKKLVDEGKIPVMNALALRKVKDQYEDHLAAAMTESPATFVPKIEQAVKESRSAALQGRKPSNEFRPTGKVRKTSEVKAALIEADATGSIDYIQALIETQGLSSPMEVAIAILKWTMCLDPVSVAAEKAKWDADQAVKAENKKVRAEEAKARKEKQAAEEVANTLAV